MPQMYISPWPYADAQRRRAGSPSRNLWKQPEPPPKPKPKQYFVLGMEVDYNTYREYNYEKTWTIDGDVLKGIPCTLWSLEHFATDEHAKDYPIEAANARKILDQIRDEIATVTGKDDKNMKTPRTAADFIDALSDIYTESRNAHASLQDKVDEAAAKMERAREDLRDPSCKDKQMAQLRLEIAQREYKLAEDDFRRKCSHIQGDFSEKVKALREQLAVHLDDHYSASPDKLDTATMQLLNAGICTVAELGRLAERHKGNPTMLRMIASYAKEKSTDRHLRREDTVACNLLVNMASAARNGSREMNIFDSAVSAAERGIQRDSMIANRMHTHIVGWFDDFRNQMNNLPNIPTDIAPKGENNEE